MNEVFKSIRSFVIEEDGAQILEYALIVAVVSLGLTLALQPLADSGYFGPFLTRLGNCLTGAGCS